MWHIDPRLGIFKHLRISLASTNISSEPSARKMSLARLQILSPLDFMEQFIRLQS